MTHVSGLDPYVFLFWLCVDRGENADTMGAETSCSGNRNYISYGSEAKEEEDMAFLCWEKDGVSYSIMDPGAKVNANTLCAVAQELLEK